MGDKNPVLKKVEHKADGTDESKGQRAVLSHAEILFGKNALHTITLNFPSPENESSPLPRGRRSLYPTFLLAETARLALRLHQSKDVTFSHRSLNVAHDLTVLIVQEFNAYLSHLTARARAADHFHNNCAAGGRLVGFRRKP
jgi:hypothetical protein